MVSLFFRRPPSLNPEFETRANEKPLAVGSRSEEKHQIHSGTLGSRVQRRVWWKWLGIDE